MRPASNQLVAELGGCSFSGLSDAKRLSEILETCIVKAELGLLSTHVHEYEPYGLTVLSIINESHVVMHTYPEAAHVSVDIFTCSKDISKPNYLLELLQKELLPQSSRVQHLERGEVLKLHEKNRVTISRSDAIDVSMQVHKKIFKTQSAYQEIEIFNSKQFGKILVLDRHLQVAESDLEFYNEQLLFSSDFKDSEVLVLGGGDGAAASRIIESDAKQVTLVDVDSEVSSACEKYFKECSRGVFENLKLEYLKKDVIDYLSSVQTNFSQRSFDHVIYDLTVHPEAFTSLPRESFLEQVFVGISKILKPGGSLLMQSCSEFDTSSRELTEHFLEKHFKQVSYKLVYVPSFACRWLFAKAEL